MRYSLREITCQQFTVRVKLHKLTGGPAGPLARTNLRFLTRSRLRCYR